MIVLFVRGLQWIVESSNRVPEEREDLGETTAALLTYEAL